MDANMNHFTQSYQNKPKQCVSVYIHVYIYIYILVNLWQTTVTISLALYYCNILFKMNINECLKCFKWKRSIE